MEQEYIKESYEKLRKKLGRQPSKKEFYEHTNITSYSLLRSGFRTYSQLCKTMGDIAKTFAQDGKDEEVFLNSYGRMVRKLKRLPSTQDWIFHKCQPAISSYRKKFKFSKWKDMAVEFLEYAKGDPEWEDVVNIIPNTETSLINKKTMEPEECYVYLMFDSKTLCHKIGISNLPDWRERTLQSQKPSIKLVVAKKFINRRIAANFEKALHDSYSHKRQRGEWFLLDQEDIDEIKFTLKE